MTRNGDVSTKAVILFLVVVCPGLALAQNGRGGTPPSAQGATLAKPVDWGTYETRMFKSVARNVRFTLQTSWIPGENGKGMFRYKMNVSPDMSEPYSAEDVEALMNKVHGCQLFLNLFDVDGFVLRELSVPILIGVDEKARVNRRVANTSSQMDPAEYRQFVGSASRTGSWNVGWNCGGRD